MVSHLHTWPEGGTLGLMKGIQKHGEVPGKDSSQDSKREQSQERGTRPRQKDHPPYAGAQEYLLDEQRRM